eukprot:s2174_g1.t1
MPESYKERVQNAIEKIYGKSRKLVPPTGKPFTQDDVRAEQPDTDDYHDPKNLDESMFPKTASAAQPPKKASGDEVQWPQSSSAFRAAARSSYVPMTRIVRAYYMEDHIQEYSYTTVINDRAEEVPAVLINDVAYELEVKDNRDFEQVLQTRKCDKRFSDFATRINKVTRGHGPCEGIRMDHDLFIDLEDFATALRKEM